jgi:phosphoglycerol transferase MdoB-like AlkP superfamily enzyme
LQCSRPGYGSALLGYHYYTWAFIGFAVAIALTAIALLFDRQFAQADLSKPAAAGLLARAAVWLVIALVALNVVSTLLECGFAACPDNPVSYQLLKSTR